MPSPPVTFQVGRLDQVMTEPVAAAWEKKTGWNRSI